MSANPDDGAIERAAAEAPARRSPQANTLVIGLGGVLLLAAVGVLAHVLTTRSRDAVVDADFIELASPINGQLDALRVEAGDAVRTGQQLALVRDPRASEADVRRLRTALDTARADLDRLDRQLALERQLAVRFQQDASTYRRLETDRTGNELDQLQAARAREQEEVAFSQRDLQRQETLFRAGAIAETVVDRARTSLQQNRDQLQGIEARIRAQTNRLQAAESDLSLDRTRSSSDPLPRLQQSQLKLAQLEGEQAGSRRRVAGLEAQLRTAETLYRQQQQVWLEAPRQAVVWRVQARSGDTLRAQQPVLRLVTCSSRWVNTYVSEADLKRLQIGSRARVDLIGESLDLRGRVDLIRSGVGRLSGRDGEPSALPINLARESQVRVRIDSDVPAPPRKLCFVGYSARVIFP
jgi:multidrug resistance efflux pump